MNRRGEGTRIERRAVLYLMLRGYKIVSTNYYTPYGEIDIIALKGKTLVFAEVRSKTERSAELYGTPAESVGYRKQQNILKSARHFISDCRMPPQEYRFDVIEVIKRGTKIKVNHIKDAFINNY